MNFLKSLNWKKVASSAAAAGVMAVVGAVAKGLPPEYAVLAAPVVAAVAHWVDAWGANPVVPADETIQPPSA